MVLHGFSLGAFAYVFCLLPGKVASVLASGGASARDSQRNTVLGKGGEKMVSLMCTNDLLDKD